VPVRVGDELGCTGDLVRVGDGLGCTTWGDLVRVGDGLGCTTWGDLVRVELGAGVAEANSKIAALAIITSRAKLVLATRDWGPTRPRCWRDIAVRCTK
jgi:hypothetical protein